MGWLSKNMIFMKFALLTVCMSLGTVEGRVSNLNDLDDTIYTIWPDMKTDTRVEWNDLLTYLIRNANIRSTNDLLRLKLDDLDQFKQFTAPYKRKFIAKIHRKEYVEKDECLNKPCKNGATCNDYYLFFNCSCAAGFSGKFCQTANMETVEAIRARKIKAGIDILWPEMQIDTNVQSYDLALYIVRHLKIWVVDDLLLLKSDDLTGFPKFSFLQTEKLIDLIKSKEDINECESSPCKGWCIDHFLQAGCPCILHDYSCAITREDCYRNCDAGTCSVKTDGVKCICREGFTGDQCRNTTFNTSTDKDNNFNTSADTVNNFNSSTDTNIDFNSSTDTGWTLIYQLRKAIYVSSGRILENQKVDVGDLARYLVRYAGVRSVDDLLLLQPQDLASFKRLTAPYRQPIINSLKEKEKIDECRSSPCRNGATCIDHFFHFKCICSVGFAGLRCETDTTLDFSIRTAINTLWPNFQKDTKVSTDELATYIVQNLSIATLDNLPLLRYQDLHHFDTLLPFHKHNLIKLIEEKEKVNECEQNHCEGNICIDYFLHYGCPCANSSESWCPALDMCHCFRGTCSILKYAAKCLCPIGYTGEKCESKSTTIYTENGPRHSVRLSIGIAVMVVVVAVISVFTIYYFRKKIQSFVCTKRADIQGYYRLIATKEEV